MHGINRIQMEVMQIINIPLPSSSNDIWDPAHEAGCPALTGPDEAAGEVGVDNVFAPPP